MLSLAFAVLSLSMVKAAPPSEDPTVSTVLLYTIFTPLKCLISDWGHLPDHLRLDEQLSYSISLPRICVPHGSLRDWM